MSKGILETIEQCINLGPGRLTIRQLQRALRIEFDVRIPIDSLQVYLDALARTGRVDMVTGTGGTGVWPKSKPSATRSVERADHATLTNRYRAEARMRNIASPFRQSLYISARLRGLSADRSEVFAIPKRSKQGSGNE